MQISAFEFTADEANEKRFAQFEFREFFALLLADLVLFGANFVEAEEVE